MRKGFLLALAVWLASTGLASAQGPALYGNVEYLLYWIKDGPNPNPLLTTGPPTGTGLLGTPGTQVLFGGNDLEYGTFSGIRATIGGWLDAEAGVGMEGRGFLLERRSTGFSAQSDPQGNPLLAFPVFDVSNNAPNAFLLALPDQGFGPTIGGATFISETRLWGAEANGVVNLLAEDNLLLDGLVGFCYLHLEENLLISGNFTALSPPPFAGTLEALVSDHFSTRNQFYGGQIGSRLRFQFERLSLGLLGMVALGSTHQVVSASGQASFQGTGAFAGGLPPVGLGGVYTLASNLGTQTRDTFTVVPQAQVELAYNLTDWLRFGVGYNFLYWNSVVRPGNQIDPNINTTLAAIPSLPTPIGPVAPLPQFNKDDFFAHGVSFSLALTY